MTVVNSSVERKEVEEIVYEKEKVWGGGECRGTGGCGEGMSLMYGVGNHGYYRPEVQLTRYIKQLIIIVFAGRTGNGWRRGSEVVKGEHE